MPEPEIFPQRIADVEAALVSFLEAIFATYFEVHPSGDRRGGVYPYGGQFERGIEALTPVLPAILLRYFGSDFDPIDETGNLVERTAHFEFFYVFHSTRGEAEARLACMQLMQRVVQKLGGHSFADLTEIFVPASEEFFFGEAGLVVYRQAWRTHWEEE